MATLRIQLEEAKNKTARLEEDIKNLSKVNNANRDLKSDLKSANNKLEEVNQRLHDVVVITEAFISTERTTEQEEVGNYRGTPNYEMVEVESEVVKILRVIYNAASKKSTNSLGYSSF